MIHYRLSFLTFLALLLGSELLLYGFKSAYWARPWRHELVSQELLEDRLRALEQSRHSTKVLVLGDSVFYGSALRQRNLMGWRNLTPVAFLVKEASWKGAQCLDFSADGLYPLDMEALLNAGLGLKPDAVVLELNYRMFSPEALSGPKAFSRKWLRPWLGPAVPLQDEPPQKLEERLEQGLASTLRKHWMLYRYSELASQLLWQPSLNEVFAGR